ncbi:hypothetical protein AVEN_113756-1 [Araneus ventricosus]|uniref:Uncharacterized protein n=1 Tax=Araneus ventricosus TaxID=182803 RepID=A0A4Y2VC85_ARAVE|nr:hypothetical protein AVEN_113756-1 [Araneus ventricosus]
MRELFTTITGKATDALASPRGRSILPVPTMGNNANRGRNSWKGRPLERGLTREATDAVASSRGRSVLPVPTMGNNADEARGNTGRWNAA